MTDRTTDCGSVSPSLRAMVKLLDGMTDGDISLEFGVDEIRREVAAALLVTEQVRHTESGSVPRDARRIDHDHWGTCQNVSEQAGSDGESFTVHREHGHGYCKAWTYEDDEHGRDWVYIEDPHSITIREADGTEASADVGMVFACLRAAGWHISRQPREMECRSVSDQIREVIDSLDDDPRRKGTRPPQIMWSVQLADLLTKLEDIAGHTEPEFASQTGYYILDARQCVGNCALWWRPAGKGYACDLDDAGVYSLDEALSHRRTDVPVPVSVARVAQIAHVRWDRLRQSGVNFDGDALDDYIASLREADDKSKYPIGEGDEG